MKGHGALSLCVNLINILTHALSVLRNNIKDECLKQMFPFQSNCTFFNNSGHKGLLHSVITCFIKLSMYLKNI